MDKAKVMKACISMITSVLASRLGILYIPIVLVIVCNVVDYVTGLMAAPRRADGHISSYKSMRGIFKKIAMWILIVVGAIVDVLLLYMAQVFGYTWPFAFVVAAVVAVWIVCNEIISILENLIDIGINLPPFLLPLVKNIKKKAEDVVNVEEENNE